jgi:D-cysteine desulfhydrase
MAPSSSSRRPFPIVLLLLLLLLATVDPSVASAVDGIQSVASSRAGTMRSPAQLHPYVPPAWCHGRLLNVPSHRLHLANLPTPIYQVEFPRDESSSSSSMFSSLFASGASAGTCNSDTSLHMRLLVKRDDATAGVEMGGNKLRKLEFLLADALWHKCDSVVTIGGVQSNHCRATAAASRALRLEPHLILRAAPAAATADLGTVGNLLVDRAVGAALYTCTPGEYGRLGSHALVERLGSYLRNQQGKSPYLIPVGGSNGIGSWGYIQGVDELVQQLEGETVDHVVFASGSGGTAAGIALGLALVHQHRAAAAAATVEGADLPPPSPQVHAVGVCDTPDYFYDQVTKIALEMGLRLSGDNEPSAADVERFVRQHLTVHQGKGLGYAVSTPEELEFVSSFARETGIVLDPVYTGKALYQFLQLVQNEADPNTYRDKTVLFWHTGGALGLYDKVDESFLAMLQGGSPRHRLDVYGKGNGIDISSETLESD